MTNSANVGAASGLPSLKTRRWGFGLLGFGLLLATVGTYLGLGLPAGSLTVPDEQYMGVVYRIMYVHVPTAWTAMLALTASFVWAIAFLFSGKWKWDSLLESTVEVGVVLCLLLCIQGAIWAKPTWGVWWDWDPRLTTMAVLLFLFLGILALRRFVDDPVRRATWSAVATIVAFVDVPVVYFSVKWWNSLHQQQSSPSTVDSIMHLPLRLNSFAVIFIVAGLIVLRSAVASMRLKDELGPPLPAAPESNGAAAGGQVGGAR
jgi:heme exporter protein C